MPEPVTRAQHRTAAAAAIWDYRPNLRLADPNTLFRSLLYLGLFNNVSKMTRHDFGGQAVFNLKSQSG